MVKANARRDESLDEPIDVFFPAMNMLMRSGKANAWLVCCWMLLFTGFALEGWGQHSLFIKTDGSLWAMGSNNYGQLGDGTTTDRNSSVQIESRGVTSFAVGLNHSLYVKDGALYSMGQNTYGQLGDGTTTDRNSTVQNVSEGVSKVAAGIGHSIFIKSDGSLWAMGVNNFGQLGDGTMDNSPTPIEIESSEVTAIAAGGQHTLYLKSDGSLHAMGYNADGQLGNGTTTDSSTPIEVEQMDVTSIAAGSIHSLYLKSDGSLWTMGANAYGQLGDGTATNRPTPFQAVAANVTSIAASGNASYFIKNNDSLWAMGDNHYGQLGTESIPQDDLAGWWPMQGNAEDASGNSNDGTVTGPILGMDRFGVADEAYSFDGVDDLISVSGGETLEITSNLSVFLWYKNLEAGSTPSIGLISQSDQSVTEGWRLWTEGSRVVRINLFHPSNTWVQQAGFESGYNEWKHLGFVFSNMSVQAYQDGVLGFDMAAQAEEISYGNGALLRIGKAHTAFFQGLVDDVRIYNRALSGAEILALYQADYNSSIPIQVISSGVNELSPPHFIKNDGSLWGMGLNQYGQLGDGTDTTRSTPVQIHTGFEMQPKRVSFTVNSGGTVSGDGTYNLNSTINLIASPSLGYLFSGWSGISVHRIPMPRCWWMGTRTLPPLFPRIPRMMMRMA